MTLLARKGYTLTRTWNKTLRKYSEQLVPIAETENKHLANHDAFCDDEFCTCNIVFDSVNNHYSDRNLDLLFTTGRTVATKVRTVEPTSWAVSSSGTVNPVHQIKTTYNDVGIARPDADEYQSVLDKLLADESYAASQAYRYDDGGAGTPESIYVEGVLSAVEFLKPAEGTGQDPYFTGNFWFDRERGKLATGGVRFTTGPDGNVAFYCVRSSCDCAVTWSGFAGDKRDFLWLAFIHGLNHGAKTCRPYGERVLNDPFMPEK